MGNSKVDLHLLGYSGPKELMSRGRGISRIEILLAPGPIKRKRVGELEDWLIGWIGEIRRAVQKDEVPWEYTSVESGLQEFIDSVLHFDPFLGGCILFLTSSGHLVVSRFDLENWDQIVLPSLPAVLRSF